MDELPPGKWTELQTRLPVGWTLDSLQCASSGLARHLRSQDLVAVAIGPEGQEQRYQAGDPLTALDGLARILRATE
jgi:hypothetical protein